MTLSRATGCGTSLSTPGCNSVGMLASAGHRRGESEFKTIQVLPSLSFDRHRSVVLSQKSKRTDDTARNRTVEMTLSLATGCGTSLGTPD